MPENTRENRIKQDILDFDTQMQIDKDDYEPVFQDIVDNILTHQPPVRTDTKKGENRGAKQFDGTPSSALHIFANGMQGLMVSPQLRWFKLRLKDEELNNDKEVAEWLQDTEERLYSAFQGSNFYTEIIPYLKDGGSIGTAAMFIEEEIISGRIFFTTLPIREFKIAENQHKVIDRLHRDFEMTARQIERKFGRESLSPEMQSALTPGARAKNRMQKFKIKHAVLPGYELDGIRNGNKPWASVYLAMNGKRESVSSQMFNEKAVILRESGFDEFPYAVWRFDKETDEVYGRSPAWRILSEIKGVHYLEKNMMKATELSINPPMNVHVNQENQFKRLPGAFNYFKDVSEKADAVDMRINWPIGAEHQDRKRELIKQAYFVDFFLLIASRDTTMTATEVLELQGEKISILAPIVTSLSSEALDKVIDRVFSIELNAGRLQEPPRTLQGQNIDIVYIGPLAQAQRRAFETQGIRQSLEAARPIMEFNPSVMVAVDWDGVFQDLLKSGGFPEKRLLTEEQIDEIKEIQRQQAERQQQLIEAEQQSGSLKNMALADKAVGGKITKQLESQA